MTKRFFTLLLILAPLGCGSDSESAKPTADGGEAKKSAASPLASITLAEDPGEALAISAAREIESGQDVVVVGRIDDIVIGYASFTLKDLALEYCGQASAEDCKTPWDYCCIDPDTQKANRLNVGIYDKDGNILEAASLPGLRLLDLVAVKGKLSKDEHGNVSIEATSIQRRERPELPDGLRWPQ